MPPDWRPSASELPYNCCFELPFQLAFQVLDEATRRTGHIVKVTRTLSFKGFKLKQLNLKLVRWDAGCKSRLQDLYPQQLGQMLFVDPPKSILWAWNHLVWPLLPRRVAEKTHLISSAGGTLERHSKLESLPAFLGGTSRMPWPPPQSMWPPAIGALTYGPGGTFRRYDTPRPTAVEKNR